MDSKKTTIGVFAYSFITRLLCAVVSGVTMWWTYKVGAVLFAEDNTFNGGDPFVIILLPFFLMFAILILGALTVLITVSTISAAYAAHPPFAAWILKQFKQD